MDKMVLATPLGEMLAVANELGICFLGFVDKLNDEVRYLDEVGVGESKKNNKYLRTLKSELEEYFAGERKEFTVPVVLEGTEFQKAAWKQLQKIPYGKTISYGRQAGAISRPKAVRAIGAANGKNKLVIIVPCHRVVGSNGRLTGYSGGVWRKEKLLDLEAKNV